MAERLALAPGSSLGPTTAVAARDPLQGGGIYRRALDQAGLLRSGRWDQVDLPNVADEIEDVGESDYLASEMKLECVLNHIVEWKHQPQRRRRAWSGPISEHRLQIEKLSRHSASLKGRREAVVAEACADARRIASRQTSLPLSAFAGACANSLLEVMSSPYEVNEA